MNNTDITNLINNIVIGDITVDTEFRSDAARLKPIVTDYAVIADALAVKAKELQVPGMSAAADDRTATYYDGEIVIEKATIERLNYFAQIARQQSNAAFAGLARDLLKELAIQ